VLHTTNPFNVELLSDDFHTTIINLSRINDIRRVNKFLEAVNAKLLPDGVFICCAETKRQRHQRILRKYIPGFNYGYAFIDFVFKRVVPKLPLTKQIYFSLTNGRNRVMSRAEILGRLYSCGFQIINERVIRPNTYFVVKKVKEPAFDTEASYGMLFRMKRIGKNGKVIKVYKFRTMHPYAEYLHDYILKKSGYSQIGKPSNDFRLTGWGKFLRKYWLDELPQLYNVLKGEMKLVGVRPLSKRVFEDYPDDIKEKRMKQKPGCFPPYVALLMQNMEKSIDAERIYLAEKEKRPYTTDFKYFCKSVYNILTNKIRSS